MSFFSGRKLKLRPRVATPDERERARGWALRLLDAVVDRDDDGIQFAYGQMMQCGPACMGVALLSWIDSLAPGAPDDADAMAAVVVRLERTVHDARAAEAAASIVDQMRWAGAVIVARLYRDIDTFEQLARDVGDVDDDGETHVEHLVVLLGLVASMKSASMT